MRLLVLSDLHLEVWREWVIPPFLERAKSRGYAAKASFCFGVMPPSAMLGLS